MNLTARRSFETVAMLMIGDGLLAMIWPRGHVSIWRNGPPAWRRMFDVFAERPALTAAVGAAETVVGLWLARSQAGRRDLIEDA